jgi:thiol-disulfide isomerase/thioredoxin
MRFFSQSSLVFFLVLNSLIQCIASTEEATIDLDDIATESVSGAIPEASDGTATDAEYQESIVEATQQDSDGEQHEELPLQSGPFIDLFGPVLLSLEMLDETHAQLAPQLTNNALKGKKVVGLYFSADWCGPCRQFTPELNSFYTKMNKRRGRKDEFEIVWISRCRDTNSYGQYFTQMGGWLALPPEEAMGQRGAWLGEKFKVKSIPTLVLLDDLGVSVRR